MTAMSKSKRIPRKGEGPFTSTVSAHKRRYQRGQTPCLHGRRKMSGIISSFIGQDIQSIQIVVT
jgi:hypothetical protein